METKYHRDMNHNYMIIKSTHTKKMSQHAIRMITGNDIPGLLSVSKRHFNGNTYLYYEINSLQNLQVMFENRKMDKQMAIRLLNGLYRAVKEVNNYLLNENGLLLKPEYIYLNWEKEEVYFIYYPCESEFEPIQIKSLFEYLVRIIDHHDEQLTDMIYDLYQSAERNTLNAEELHRHISEISFSHALDSDLCQEHDSLGMIATEAAENETILADKDNSFDLNHINNNINDVKKQERKYLALSLISAAGAVFTVLYQNLIVLSASENLLAWILLVVFIIFFFMAGAAYLLLMYRNKNLSGIEEDRKTDTDNKADNEFQNLTVRNITQLCGDTIFLNEEAYEGKLYGCGRGSKYIIDLINFPFIIGKLASNTDYNLSDSSISRLHVKFTKQDNAIFMTDLNSTNGTYKNGLRLDPSETVSLEAGDEVRFGKLSFYYR